MPTWTKWYRDDKGEAHPHSLFLTGALLAVEIHVPTQLAAALTAQGKPVPPGKSGWALIDTGAMTTCVHEQALKDLGVSPVGIVKTGTAGGPTERLTYPARLVFPETGWDQNVAWPLTSVDLTGQTITYPGQEPRQIMMLLGRDFLRSCLLVWNGLAATWSLSF